MVGDNSEPETAQAASGKRTAEVSPPLQATLLRRALASDPQAAGLHFALGLVLEAMGAREQAIICFARETIIDPGHLNARLRIAINQSHYARWAQAAHHFSIAMVTRPDEGMILFNLGFCQLKSGQAAAALRMFLHYDAIVPGDHRAALLLGRAFEEHGDWPHALEWYQRATELCPSSGENFTDFVCAQLRKAFDWPKLPVRRAATPRIACSILGRRGRFGNSILQYGFLRCYAAEYGLGYEVPNWVGRYLFEGNDPWPSTALQFLNEEDARFEDSLARRTPLVYVNYDFNGHFCYNTASMARHRQLFGRIFEPNRIIGPLLDRAVERLRCQGRTLVVAHLRRGDFGAEPFWIAPEQWYLDWLEAHWAGLTRPVLYIASDDPAILASFRAFAPLTRQDLGETIPGAEFYLDFHMLSRGDVVLISNSTFSFTATMIGAAQPEGDRRRFFRPDRELRALVPFDPWDADPPQLFRVGPPPRAEEVRAQTA